MVLPPTAAYKCVHTNWHCSLGSQVLLKCTSSDMSVSARELSVVLEFRCMSVLSADQYSFLISMLACGECKAVTQCVVSQFFIFKDICSQPHTMLFSQPHTLSHTVGAHVCVSLRLSF